MTVQAEIHEYSVVREEKETEKNEFGTHETIKGYDSKGRLVMIRQSSELLDGGRSHFPPIRSHGRT